MVRQATRAHLTFQDSMYQYRQTIKRLGLILLLTLVLHMELF